MVFDCSFAEYGNYGEMGNAWESLQINSISIVPEGVTDVETVYCADTANMSDVSVCVCVIMPCIKINLLSGFPLLISGVVFVIC